jgi:hypothetical protein
MRKFYRASPSNRLSYIVPQKKKAEAQFLGMKHLQTWLIHFYTNRPHIVQKPQRLAVKLGELKWPPLRWRYASKRGLVG